MKDTIRIYILIEQIAQNRGGKNLVRNFHELGALYAICDSDPKQLQNIANKHGITTTFSDYHKVFSCDEIDAVVIATPAETHYVVKNYLSKTIMPPVRPATASIKRQMKR
ncbi:MAG: Gfo/Idh/MocA family oxidoreductase [Candidatus Omnitrophica bacterium]|nr:Gfo/Idh/MocA family oxidoreductase [Candidatus Omnitrophota bacterium]